MKQVTTMDDDSFERKSNRERSSKGRTRARCPSCSAWVLLRDAAEVWDLLSCPECNAALEIVELRPPTLDYANVAVEDWEVEEEDWEDEI